MGITRTDLFTEDQNKLAELARVLAHPARIAILQHLQSANTCINSDLVQELGLAQATISQHLKELKASGLIKGNIDGVRMCYCIDPDQWKIAAETLSSFFTDLPAEEKCC